MHASLAVHVCTELGTTAQILQRTYKKYLSGLREKRIALYEKWAMRFVEKASVLYICTFKSEPSVSFIGRLRFL